MAQLIQHLQHWQAQQCPADVKRYVVALSGGQDSSALLHALKGISNKPILAIHVNHGLHPEADHWQAQCQSQCEAWGIEFKALRVELETQGKSVEAEARKARYAALTGCIKAGDALLTAHHERDQAETLLLQLFRGAGVAGLAAMPQQASFAEGYLLRPLLTLPKAALEEYAKANALSWIDDPSNADSRLDRNYLRAEVLPGLRKRWPALDASLARSAAHSAEADQLLTELGQADLDNCALDNSAIADRALSIAALRDLSQARCANALRLWLRKHGHQAPSTAQLQRIHADLLVQREDAQPVFALPEYELRRYRDALYMLEPLPTEPGDVVLAWDANTELDLPPGCGCLRAVPAQPGAAGLKPGQFQVRFVQGGERIKPPGSPHHRRLKQLFQSSGVPPWVRMRTPLIYHGQELVAVADVWLNADYLDSDAEMAWRPQWSGGPPGWPVQGSAA
ncbi:MAG: tRNA lysidine(34) synthetase TilS [Salinisphaeraceae bacterium]|nr:tRNA lysidine(34) synthetase TilS [Salinisphaeraceae bacterium]